MSKRKRADQPELPLFDEPLQDFPLRADESVATASPREAATEVPQAEPPETAREPAGEPPPATPGDASAAPGAGLGDRLPAAAIDLGVHLLVLAFAVLAPRWMGISLAAEDWPPFAGLMLVFSFIYWVMALAFWGQTPGMARARLEARGDDGERLTIGQAIGRWVGALLTTAGAGLPLVVAASGRSLSDRLSGSRTVKLQYS